VGKKLVTEVKQERAYVLNESNNSEAIFSLHVPFKTNSYFVEV